MSKNGLLGITIALSIAMIGGTGITTIPFNNGYAQTATGSQSKGKNHTEYPI